jgi:hypothetical protein
MSHYPHIHRRADDPVDAEFDRMPPGMTAEQLEFFTEQTERAVDKGVRRGVKQYRNNALIAFVLLFAGFLYNANNNRIQDRDSERANADGRAAIVQSGDAVAIDGCNRAYEERLKIRDVFQNSKRLVQSRVNQGLGSADDAKAAIDFYDQQLESFKLPDCRKAASLLTDDPSKPIPMIEPWYPENPDAPQSAVDVDKSGG